MAEKKTVTTPEKVEGEVVNAVAITESREMEFKLINPTEDGFLHEIKWNREELESGIRQKIASYENLVYTEETMKDAKADRANLNKLITAIEDRRKQVKNIVMEPYATFESEIKEVLELIRKPVGMIDTQITEFEDQQKEEKKKQIKTVYDDSINDLATVLPFEKVFDSRYLNKTYKLVQAQTEVREKVDRVRTDLGTIDALDSKYKLNAKDVYIKTLDLSKALAENKRLSELEEKLEAENRRKAAEEAERKRKAEEKEAERKRIEEEKRLQSASRPSQIPYPPVPRSVQSEVEENVSKPAQWVGESASNVSNHQESVTEPVKSVSEAVKSVSEEEKSVSEEAKSVVAPPTGDCTTTDPFARKDTKQYKASFTIFGTKDEIMGVKQYMIDNNIKFGKVEN